jgi:hypothetical protein
MDPQRGGLSTILASWLFGLVLCACTGTPAGPGETVVPTGRWSGDGACLSVTDKACDLVVGCAHGQFSRPTVHRDGTFAADGTYRIEAGPISINPAPPAKFSGVLTASTLTVRVVPSDTSLRPASYTLRLTNDSARCSVPCL